MYMGGKLVSWRLGGPIGFRGSLLPSIVNGHMTVLEPNVAASDFGSTHLITPVL